MKWVSACSRESSSSFGSFKRTEVVGNRCNHPRSLKTQEPSCFLFSSLTSDTGHPGAGQNDCGGADVQEFAIGLLDVLSASALLWLRTCLYPPRCLSRSSRAPFQKEASNVVLRLYFL